MFKVAQEQPFLKKLNKYDLFSSNKKPPNKNKKMSKKLLLRLPIL